MPRIYRNSENRISGPEYRLSGVIAVKEHKIRRGTFFFFFIINKESILVFSRSRRLLASILPQIRPLRNFIPVPIRPEAGYKKKPDYLAQKYLFFNERRIGSRIPIQQNGLNPLTPNIIFRFHHSWASQHLTASK